MDGTFRECVCTASRSAEGTVDVSQSKGDTSADLEVGRELTSLVFEDPGRVGRVMEERRDVEEGDSEGLEVPVNGFETIDLEVSGRDIVTSRLDGSSGFE